MHPSFTGSKRKQREQQRVDAVKRRLNRIYDLARLLKTPEELETYLAQIPSVAQRDACRTLITPFCLFSRPTVELATPIDVNAAVADGPRILGDVNPADVLLGRV